MSRLDKLRENMKKSGVSACIIPTSDPHLDEYIPEHYKLREYLSGFTGSAGTLVVTQKESGLWTDGRYYIQAEIELSGRETVLFKASEKDCEKITDYLRKRLGKREKLGLDGRLFSKKRLDEIIKELGEIKVKTDFDAAVIWEKRPSLPINKAFVFDEKYCGEGIDSKISRVRLAVKEKGFTHYLVCSPESIMWLLNIRGNDVRHTPVMLSYLIISENEITLYADEEKLTGDVAGYLNAHNIKVADYNAVYNDVKKLSKKFVLGADFNETNYTILSELKCSLNEDEDIISSFKAVKNETEIENIKKAYLKENIALAKSFYEIFHSEKLTECDVCDIIEKHRQNQASYFSPSFDTIAAYGPNAAIIHYSPEKGECTEIKKKGMLLIDTGGQYFEGTTDTTRTLVMGELTKEEREHLTIVLKGCIDLLMTAFPEGTRGCDLDAIARRPLWEKGLDYRYSTGHGIGHFLSVHEGPHRISSSSLLPLKEGATVSDEPGIYVENKYGIRIENHLCVKREISGEYGNFLSFEVLNYCPIGTEGIAPELLDKREKDWLNSYNEKCCELISPHLNEEEVKWLKAYTRKI